MKILVAVKRVVDPNVRIRIAGDGSGIDIKDLKTTVNPFDEVAVEQGVRLKEAGKAAEVVLVSIGPAAAKDTLRAALALGADRAVLVECAQALEPLAVAHALAEVVRREKPDLVLLGKQSVDADAAQCGPMLAALLDWPQATFASALVVADGKLTVTRDVEMGVETLSMPLPAVVTADLRLAEPRYATLPNTMAARRKPLEVLPIAGLVAPEKLANRLTVISASSTDKQRHVQLLPDAAALVDKLRNEARVLEATA